MAKTATAAATRDNAASKPARPATKTAAKPAAKPAVKKAAPEKANGAASAPAPAKAAKTPAKAKPAADKDKPKKPKLVRDSFSMPEAEYRVLGDMKKTCLKAGFDVKKSELLRIGVALIRQMDAARLKEVLATLPPLKAGRPKKEK